MRRRERAEPERPDQHADQDEADDRADPEPGEGGDDDPGGAEDDQRVAEAGRRGRLPCHTAFRAGARRQSSAMRERAALSYRCRLAPWRHDVTPPLLQTGPLRASGGPLKSHKSAAIRDFSDVRRRIDLIIVGGGPAGMMAGLLFARAGCDVLVLEKHADFFRDFRGDTVHPSTLEILDELGLLDEFLKRPHDEVDSAELRLAGREWHDRRPDAICTRRRRSSR